MQNSSSNPHALNKNGKRPMPIDIPVATSNFVFNWTNEIENKRVKKNTGCPLSINDLECHRIYVQETGREIAGPFKQMLITFEKR
eukprot:707326-Rhodomonas_salina.1